MESDSSIFTTILLFIIALLPVVVIFKYINHKDVNKEPTSLLVRLFLDSCKQTFQYLRLHPNALAKYILCSLSGYILNL